MIHRALLGSLERFVGIYLEHTGGDLPLFLAPEQVRILPVAAAHLADAESLADRLRAEGFRASVDEREETLGRRIATPSSRRCPTSSSGAIASRSTPSRSGDGVVTNPQQARTRSSTTFAALLVSDTCKQELRFLTSGAMGSSEVQPNRGIDGLPACSFSLF
jgi:hypothetical protein